jgi:ATP-dependent Clp protease ATP-binding subunit ClpC
MEYVLDETLTRKDERGITYEVADVLLHAKQGNLTAAFMLSRHGKKILARCNVDETGIRAFLAEQKVAGGDLSRLRVPQSGFLTLRDVAKYVYDTDTAFSDFLFAGGTDKDNFEGALNWVFRSHYLHKQRARWWARDNLGRVQGIGVEWSYGRTWHLERYTKPIEGGSVFSTLSRTSGYAHDRIRQLEAILARAKEANVMLIGEPGVGKTDIIAGLERDIRAGTALAPLAQKSIVIFDSESFIATNGKKETFEPELKRLLDQASAAGNVIFVVANLASFIASAKALGSDIVSLLDPYLTSSEFQVIATSDPSAYHEVIAREPALIQRFENVQIEYADLVSTIRVLEDIAEEYESRSRLFFTYRALETIANAADRYITEGVMPDKAVDLFVEIAPHASSKGERVVTRQVVEAYVAGKTGVPTGEVGDAERERLLNLEEILHERVIGQDKAIETISNAMRRARAGIQNPNRPLGSFLFLGPTGVGKTETAKALAATFSGKEGKILRIDMSEYRGDEALAQLIGSFEGGKSGVLANMLREQPYGVLLLDEFEKTTADVQNLFLQILDEGFFSDARGKRVNARNLIIIATSNAGSDLIWQKVEEGKDIVSAEDEIVGEIIKGGEFRPELVNRFDGVVLFHPLSEDNLRKVASIMLESLKVRIRERGYTLVINDVLVDLLVKEGYDPKFGARPMQRVVQEVIEKKIANKIIEGSLREGASIEFSAPDFA